MSEQKMKLNGAELAILNSRFEGVARKMTNTLFRTGRSGVLNRAKDFSCCIVTADCDLLATGESLPIHVLVGPDMMARTVKDFHPEFKRGDAYIHNSPYHGCSHPADQTIIVPVIDDNNILRFWVLAKAHQADIGNSVPTTYHGEAQDVYQEGALIFAGAKVQSDYQDIQDIIRMCQLRIRVPDQWYGDYLAALGAARIGEREILKMGEQVGWDKLEAFAQQWFDYSEKRMAEALSALPEGTSTATTTHDHFPGTPEEGVTINSTVTTLPEHGRIEVDLRDNPDNMPCGLNLSEACAVSAGMVGIFNSIDHTVPKNSGSFRRIDIKLREGCIVGIPKHPASCSVATTNIADRVSNGVQSAIAELGEGFGMAECGAVIPPAVGVVSGIDPRTNKAYINQVFLGMSGGAAAPETDCWQTIGHVGNAGQCYQDSVELAEVYQPIHIYLREFLADTEGAGKHRGSSSVACEFGPIDCECEVGYVSDGFVNGPKGVRGGLGGGNSDQVLTRTDGERERLPGCTQAKLGPGEKILSISCGGGGYGSPKERAVDSVAKDVREGLISADRAASVYGVQLDAQGRVDTAATERLRAG